MSGLPKPRSITSRPSRRSSRFSWSTVAKTYGGRSWIRRNCKGATTRESTTMPVDVLRCRVCESDYPALANGICVRCFGPLEPVYDWDEIAAHGHAASASRPGPYSLWRYADLLPATPPPRTPRAAPASRRSSRRRGSRARSASARCCSSSTSRTRRTRSRTASSPSRRRRRSSSASRRSPAPRRATSRTRSPPARRRSGCRAVIFCPAGLEPEKMRATTVYGATRLRRPRQLRRLLAPVSELAGEVDWGIVNVNLRSYYAEGSKTLAFEIVEQLGWETPDAVVDADRLGRDVHEGLAGLRAVRPARADRRAAAAALRRPGRGLRPGRDGVRRGAARLAGAAATRSSRSLAIGNPADGDLAIATARASGGAIYSVPEDEIGANIALLAETAGIFGEGAPASPSARFAGRGRARPARRVRPRGRCSSPAPG